MTNEQLWQAALGELELLVSKANFTTWLKHTFVLEWLGDKIVVAVPNVFTKAWLESKYNKVILKALQNITDNAIREVIYRVETQKHAQAMARANIQLGSTQGFAPQAAAGNYILENLRMQTQTENQGRGEGVGINAFGPNPRNTFDNFIVGKNNELAHAASRAVCESPGVRYNPLFIYGGVGLGKTHLLHAVGHELIKKMGSNAKIVCVTSEKFTNDFVEAIKNGSMNHFRGVYRKADSFLVDDVQFLAGKESTIEEFFNTFNELHQTNRQIIVTSDRPPRAIPSLEERMISRFEWGMIADIAQPDLETRLAIIRAKCQERMLAVDEDVIKHLATSFQTNIREIEGALNKIYAFWELSRIEPTIETVKNILTSLHANPKRGLLSPKHVVNIVATYFDIRIDDITGNSRRKELVFPRQIAMFLMREEINSSFPAIGQELGGRDHTTAMHACNKISRELENDEKLRQDIMLIRQRLYNQS